MENAAHDSEGGTALLWDALFASKQGNGMPMDWLDSAFPIASICSYERIPRKRERVISGFTPGISDTPFRPLRKRIHIYRLNGARGCLQL
jgi:hypothetical protein